MVVHSLRFGWRCLLGAAAALLLLAIPLLLTLRFGAPYLSEYRPQLEAALADYLDHRVEVSASAVSLGWWGWQPTVQVTGLSLHDPHDRRYSLQRLTAELKLAPLASLAAGRPQLTDLRLRGGELALDLATSLRPAQSGSATGGMKQLLTRLLAINALSVDLDRLTLRAGNSSSPWFSGRVTLRLSGEHGGLHSGPRRLKLWAYSPAGRLHLRAELYRRGDGLHDPELRFYISVNDWRPTPLAPLGAILSGTAWGEWRTADGLRLTGHLASGRLNPAATVPSALLAKADRWRLDFDGIESERRWLGRLQALAGNDEKPLLSSPISLRLTDPGGLRGGGLRGGGLRGGGLELRINRLRLQELAAVAAPLLPVDRHALLARLKPSGSLDELLLRWQPGAKNRWRLAARFSGLVMGWVSGLTGRLEADRGGGLVDLDNGDRPLQIASPILPQPLVLDRLSGPLRWRTSPDWQLSSSDLRFANADFDARLQGSASMGAGDDASPYLDLRLDYRDVSVDAARRWLPTVLKPKLRAWLEQALLGGQVSAGSLSFTGRPAAFPFDAGEGHFESRSLIRDATFSYAPGWPPLRQLDAELVFDNRRFEMTALSGRLFDTGLGRVSATIADLNRPYLVVVGELSGAAERMLAFTRASPLANGVGRSLARLVADDDSDALLALDLRLALDKRDKKPGQKPQVTGRLSLAGNTLSLRRPALRFTEVHGALRFGPEGLHSDGDLRLQLHDRPATLAVDSVGDGGGPERLRFRFAGELDPGRLNPELGRYASGHSPWRATVSMPRAGLRSDRVLPTYRIDADSTLLGTAVTLPGPLAKPADAERPLKLRAQAADGRLRVALGYDPDTRAALLFSGDDLRLERGALRIAAGEAELPERPGLAVAANLPSVELASFGSAGLGAGPTADGRPLTPRLPDWLRQVQARIDRFELAGRPLHDTDLQIDRRPDGGFRLALSGPDVTGRIDLPAADRADSTPLEVTLQRLKLDGPADDRQTSDPQPAASTAVDPRRLPPLRLRVDELRRAGKLLGSLSLITRPVDGGLRLEKLTLSGANQQFQLTASGDWRIVDGDQQSAVDAELRAETLADLLTPFDYPPGLQQAPTVAEVRLSWPGPLFRPTPESLSGRVNLQLGKGRIPALEPGLGRVVGLFNLASLTRRLTLDFSDLFADGLAFDGIDAELRLGNGRAEIDQLLLRGPAAHVRMEGIIDLAERRYDQQVTVMPQFGSSLALAGALAGGPAVGAAVLVAERLLKPGFDQALAYRYSLTGPWADPLIEPLQAANPQAPDFGGHNKR